MCCVCGVRCVGVWRAACGCVVRCVWVCWCRCVHVRVGEGGCVCGFLFLFTVCFFLHFWIFVFSGFFVLVYIFWALVLSFEF